jgi:large conductance mechanosensitive channel
MSETKQKAFSLWQEFRNFAFKGNVIDLAVGVIIGAAFGAIIKSLVDNIIMPGERSYTEWALTLGGKSVPYGKFLGEVVNFLIVALALYIFIVKFLGWLMAARKEETKEPPPPTRDQELLMEIRDLLKEQRPKS